MKMFYKTTPIRIALLIIGIFVISKAAITNEMIYFTVGAIVITMREYIYNAEFYKGFLHYYNEKVVGKKQEPIEDTDDLVGIT